jgi:5-methylcytosine-specific restriction endonuclease McrBC regulatory subunit McrC
VQLPQTTLQVLPKMYRHEDAKEREATANLLFLLSYTRKLDVTEPEISRLTEQRAPLSEILFWVFAHRLWDAVNREILRGYVTVGDRLDVLKGRWLVAAQAGRPDGWRRDRFDVAYDEFTEDNLPNRLFKATVHRLSRWSQWTDTRRHLTQLRAVFADVADVTPQPHDFDEAANPDIRCRGRRRANERHRCRPLLKLARMFWTGTGPQLNAPKSPQRRKALGLPTVVADFTPDQGIARRSSRRHRESSSSIQPRSLHRHEPEQPCSGHRDASGNDDCP